MSRSERDSIVEDEGEGEGEVGFRSTYICDQSIDIWCIAWYVCGTSKKRASAKSDRRRGVVGRCCCTIFLQIG